MNKELIGADKAFSTLSKERGMNHAFLSYIAEDGVLLRPDNMPFVGKDIVKELFKSDDTKFTLTWEPLYADIANSGELGYTYGTYTLTLQDTVQNGTYVSIWKKDERGKWQFVLDSGNLGLGRH